MACVKEKNVRSYRIAPDLWPRFEKTAEALADDINGITKGDVVGAAMRMFLNMEHPMQVMMLKALRDRSDGGEPTEAEVVLTEAIAQAMRSLEQCATDKRKRGPKGP